MSIDPRIAARRAEVREVAARADARRTLWWLVAVVMLALLVWIGQGPLFSVQHLTVSGTERADPRAGLAAGGIEMGAPLVMVRAAKATEALETDAWILRATVTVTFPDRVTVHIVERQPVLRVHSDTGEFVVAADGMVLAHDGFDTSGLATAELARSDLGRIPPVGSTAGDIVRGLAEFAAELPSELALAGELGRRDGELWFDVAGISARLGRPVEMAAKATVLTALLADGIPEDSVVHLVAPLRPSVLAPEIDDETDGSDDDDSSGTAPSDGETDSADTTSGGA